jgi:hypothetical protein
LVRGAALGAVTTDFQPGDDDMEAAVPLDLTFQAVEQVTLEFRNLATAQARHVNVVPLGAAFVVVFLALHVHEIEFVNQTMSLEQSQGAIDSDPVNLGIEAAGAAQQLTGVKVLLGGLDHAQNRAALARHAQSARHQFRLQASWNLSLGQWHEESFLQLGCNIIT